VKKRKTGIITTVIMREASEYGAGCIYMHSAYPSFMITIEIHDQEDIEMLHLILERLLQIHCESEE
jgi:hypothetical protein